MRSWLALVAMLPLAPSLGFAQQAEMQGMAMGDPHITMSPHWDAQAGDRARADSVVRIAREAVERYREVAAAALKARFRFDPASPTALLYQDDAAGGLRLVGVMYTMPPDTPLEDLDRRIPLSVARWHQHTNICLPPRGTDDSEAAEDRHSGFGLRGSIATREACEAAGGRWFPRMFGWMVHLNLFASTPDAVWQDDGGGMRHF